MTRTTSARVAGSTFLLYIAIGITQMFTGRGATSGSDTAARLASIASHAQQIRIDLLISVVICFIALTLAVALYGITRDEDEELSMLAMICRVVEGGAVPVVSIISTLGLLSLAADAPTATAYPVAEFLLSVRRSAPLMAAIFFAVGSTLFSYLLLRGRMIPNSLAWLGVAASLLLVVALPLQLLGVLTGAGAQLIWAPMALFEVVLAIWFLFKGVQPARATLNRSS